MSQHLPELNYLDPETLQKIGDLELIAREAVEGLRSGAHRSQLRGFSTEFAHQPVRAMEMQYGISTGVFMDVRNAITPSFMKLRLILMPT